MRIIGFKRIIQGHLSKKSLNNEIVVFDAQRFFYCFYEDSTLPYKFGCECDKYADYVRKRLNMFKQANVECYFVFKGGDEIGSMKWQQQNEDLDDKTYILPIFMKEVLQQVLSELKFKYTLCEYGCKKECIALARHLKCPIISYDIEFAFSGVPYIPFLNLAFDDNTNTLNCDVFILGDFLYKLNLNESKLATFIFLTDETLYNGDKKIVEFLKYYKMFNLKYNAPNTKSILRHISEHSEEVVLKNIIKTTEMSEIALRELKAKAMTFINTYPKLGIPSVYILNEQHFSVVNNDPDWFTKGVAAGHISKELINLYHSRLYTDTWVPRIPVNDMTAAEPFDQSLEILKYIFDLLTDFNNQEFELLKPGNAKIKVNNIRSISKPSYDGYYVFRNGWNEIKSLKLFHHFLKESLSEFDFEKLTQVPDDAKLLMITLVYLAHKTDYNAKQLGYCVLLSHIMLGIVFEKIGKYGSKNILHEIDASVIDCESADKIMIKYWKTKEHGGDIMEKSLVLVLFQFQYCLQMMNFLNIISGSPFKPTIYKNTFNGTFIYNILSEKVGGDVKQYIMDDKLSSSLSVRSVVKHYFDLFESLL